MQEFSACGSDANGNTATASAQIVEHEDVVFIITSHQRIWLAYRYYRAVSTTSPMTSLTLPKSLYVSKIVNPITGQPRTSASGLWTTCHD